MGQVDVEFDGQIFRKDYPIIIATNRSSAKMLPVRLRYNSSGVVAGTILARNTTDGFYDSYTNGGSSGTGTAACVLFQSYDSTEFSGTTARDSTLAIGIFGGCTLYYANLVGYDSGALSSLKGTLITDASGVQLFSF